ncbi:MAG: hypothetical protein IJP72_09165 [Bacteroidales bacterium]|nr:hypothetical protein [Bacteroidales bacterium]
MKKLLPLLFALFFAGMSLSAQENIVPQSPADESDDVAYAATYQFDTTDFSEIIILYDAAGKPKDELVYKNGNYYMDHNGSLRKLSSSELRKMFSREEFQNYQQAKSQYNGSIPLFVVAGCAGGLIVAGVAWFLYDFFGIMTGSSQWDGGFASVPAFRGFLCVVTGMVVGTATIIPAVHLRGKASSVMGGIAYDYNYSHGVYDDENYNNDNNNNNNNNSTPGSGKRPASNTSMRISIGGTSQGFGLALHF